MFQCHFQQYFIYIVAIRFIGRQNEYPTKTTELLEVTDKLYYIYCIDYTSSWMGFILTTLVSIGTNCIGSCKSNSHTICIYKISKLSICSFSVKANMCGLFIVCICISVGDQYFQYGRVLIPLIVLTPPHVCAYRRIGPEWPTSYAMVVVSMNPIHDEV
jgi:hypothetical protein